LLTGSKPQGATDFRAYLPRFTEGNRAQNESVAERLKAFASARGMTVGQLTVAWVLASRPRFVPLIGAKTRTQLRDALGALEKPLSAADVAELERLVPRDAIAGTRYAAEHMTNLASERA
jgi:aryl-alcohol dehydrogenase-like predicted oxidoreductase